MSQSEIARDQKGRFVQGQRSNAIKDLTGQRFGLLQVIRLASNYRGEARWVCKCVCGNSSIVTGSNLRNGRTKSCGCWKKENVLGQKIGKGEAAFNQLFNSYKVHSKRHKRELSFSLTKKEFKKLTNQDCFYCGQKPAQTIKSRYDSGDYRYNGIDRLDNNRGYEIGNCVACCKNCNLMKKTSGLQEFLNHINKIHKYQHRR